MSWTHEIIYDDQAVAFVDIATQKQLQNQLQNTEKHQQQTTSCSTTQPSKPAIRSFNPPTYAEQLANLTLHVKPTQSKPNSNSLSILQPNNSTKQEKPPSPKPQTKRKHIQPSVGFTLSDSDDSSNHKDNTLMKNK